MLNTDYVLGLTEANGVFEIVRENGELKPVFTLTVQEKEPFVLEIIKDLMGVGEVKRIESSKTSYLNVKGIPQCSRVIEFFERKTFYTSKGKEFWDWSEKIQALKSGKELLI